MHMPENEENQRVKRPKYGGRQKGTPNRVKISRVAERLMVEEREKRIGKAKVRVLKEARDLLQAAGIACSETPLDALVWLPMPEELRLQLRALLLNLDAEVKRLADLVNNPIRRRNRKKKPKESTT